MYLFGFPGLSFSTWDLPSSLQHALVIASTLSVTAFELLVAACRI